MIISTIDGDTEFHARLQILQIAAVGGSLPVQKQGWIDKVALELCLAHAMWFGHLLTALRLHQRQLALLLSQALDVQLSSKYDKEGLLGLGTMQEF